MNPKTLKILTVILFLLITFNTGHIGGQFGTFIIFGLMSGGFGTIGSIILLLVLIIFFRNAFKSSDNDFYIFLIGGLPLLVPIIAHINFLISKTKNVIDPIFYLTTLFFLIIYGLTLLGTFKKLNKSSSNH